VLLLSSVTHVDLKKRAHTQTNKQTNTHTHTHGDGKKKAKTFRSAPKYEGNKIISNALMTDAHVNYSYMVQKKVLI
jgi:hypothetical protein